MCSQEILLKIVETWDISEAPEYRGFRCANCQKYKNEAWHHWVNTGGFRLQIHLCDTCEMQLKVGEIKINKMKNAVVDHKLFGRVYKFSQKTIDEFTKIVASWPEDKDPELKAFTCDLCHEVLDIDQKDGLRKGYHVWTKMSDDILVELHFHKACSKKLGVV